LLDSLLQEKNGLLRFKMRGLYLGRVISSLNSHPPIFRYRCMRTSSVHFFNKNLRSSPISGNEYNYEELIKDFKWNVPDHFNFSVDVIEKYARDSGDRKALWFIQPDGQDLHYTYSQLDRITQKGANVFRELGVKKAVCILPKVPEWWIINLATIRQNVVLLPGPTQLREKDISWRMEASGADCIIADLETSDKVDRLSADIKHKILVGVGVKVGWLSWKDLLSSSEDNHLPIRTHKDEIMQIFFTSGTVGRPKMVPHTHTSYGYCHTVTGKYWLDLTKDDIHWNISDTGWAKNAWSSLFGPLSQGSTVFVHGMPRFTPPQVLETLANYPITTMCAPATLYRSLLQEEFKKYNISNLRHCVSAGEPLNEEVIYRWEEALGIVIKEGYGQTETTLLCGTFKKMNKWVKPGSMGKPAPGYDVRIVNNMGREVARGEQGNIGVKVQPHAPPGLFMGYLNDPEGTANSFIGDYYLTGDRAVQDEDGYLWFQSRTDDLIISSGYRIGPFEVESALLEHQAVEESAVVSSPDVDRGSVVKAFVVLARTHKQMMGDQEAEEKLKGELQNHVKNTTAPYKYPRKIDFVESLPKTISGKIRRTELRQREYNTLFKLQEKKGWEPTQGWYS